MKDIKKLIKISDRQMVNRPKLKANPTSKRNKQAQLYEILYYNELGNEDDIAQKLYGAKASSSLNNYVKLKSRLRKKLLQSLFFLEPNNKTLKNSIDASRQIYLGKILNALRATDMSIKSLQKGMAAAVLGEHFDLANDAANELMKIGYESNNMVVYQSALKSIEEYESLSLLQAYVTRKFYEINLLVRNSAAKEKILRGINTLIYFITSNIEKEQYFTFLLKYHQLLDLKYQLNHNNTAILHNSLTAIELLNEFDNIPEKDIFYFKFQYLKACKNLQQYKNGALYISTLSGFESKRLIDENNVLMHQFSILFSFGLESYLETITKLDSLSKNKSFKSLNNKDKAIFKLYSTYAEIALCINQNKNSSKDRFCDDVLNIKIEKLIDELKPLKDDKQGSNVSLIVLELLLAILQNDFDLIHDKIDAIKTYRSRYLRLVEHKRVNLFLGLIINLEKKSFDINKLKPGDFSNYSDLKDNPEKLISKIYEVIPFEKVWNLIVTALQNANKFTKTV